MFTSAQRKLLLFFVGVLTILAVKISLPMLTELELNDAASGETLIVTVDQNPAASKEALLASSEVWGLGSQMSNYVSNSVDYNWYLDQRNTGPYYRDNSGPAALVMVGIWQNSAFDQTAEDVRTYLRSDGGWWYPDDLSSALMFYEISHEIETLESASTIKAHLDHGKIVIVNLDMASVPYTEDAGLRIGRFYEDVEGHFLIVKGYAVVDGTLYFETYDPYSMNQTYSEGWPMGLNRYYEAENFVAAALKWYDEIWVVDSMPLQ